MHRFLLAFAIALTSSFPLHAQGVDSVTQAALRSFLGQCPAEVTMTPMELGISLPTGMTATRVKVEGGSYWCDGSYYVVRSRDGRFWVGNPWPLEKKGEIAERIRNFAWNRMQQTFSAEVAADPGENGLVPVVANQVTEWGNIAIDASTDREGTFLFMGRFHEFDSSKPTFRYEIVEEVVSESPWRGAENADVTIVEFSDFQCPACAAAQPVVESLVDAHPNRIRYIRADLPLVSAHPWAMPAAIIGRAIWMQSPDAFWTYKKHVYDNQAMLNAFTLADFARGIAEDAGLDLDRLDRDSADPQTADAVRRSMAAAFSAQLVGTPTYFVNGRLVAYGPGGETLKNAIAAAIAGK